MASSSTNSGDNESHKVAVCADSDVADNGMKEVELKLGADTFKLLIVRHKRVLHALGSRCTHYSLPLAKGVLTDDGKLRCFAHGARFDVTTGDIEDFPGIDSLPKFVCRVDDGQVYVVATRRELAATKRVNKPVLAAADESIESSFCPCVPRSASVGSSTAGKALSRCVIIGSGPAGVVCADTLRSHGYAHRVTILTRESHVPYDRPALSKTLNAQLDKIQLRDDAFFASSRINFERNVNVTRVDLANRRVVCASGRTFDYDKLVIASGLLSAKPKNNDKALNGVFTLRSYDDAARIYKHFESLLSNANSANAQK